MNTHAPGHNATFYAEWIKDEPLFTRLMFKNLNIDWATRNYSKKIVPIAVAVASYVRVRQRYDDPSVEFVSTLSLGELLAPIVPAEAFLNQDDARAEMIKTVLYMMNNDIDQDIINTQDALTFRQFQLNAGYNEATILADFDPANQNLTIEQAMRLLSWRATTSPLNNVNLGLQMITCVILSVTKMGTASTHVIAKVKRDILADLNKEIDLESGCIRQFYTTYGRYVNEGNIGALFEQWGQWIPVVAQRMAIMIQQSSFAGLTAFCTIGKAIIKYDNFPWLRIFSLYHVDANNYIAAIAAVNGNQYYGFRRDLGIVRSTNYKNIAWVAKELFIRVGGDAHIGKYKGWLRRPEHADRAERIIEEYIAGLENMEVIQQNDLTTRIINGVRAPNMANFFA